MTTLSAPALRHRVDPRDIPPVQAARLLGLTLAEFNQVMPRLRGRGFPTPDPDTGRYDRKAIEAWQDRRSSLTGDITSHNASATMRDRIARLRGG